jgi:hypothetical protein
MFKEHFPKKVPFKKCTKNISEPDRPEMTVKHDAEKIRFACRMTKAIIDKHS